MRRFPLILLAVAVPAPTPAHVSAQRSVALWAGVNATWREDASLFATRDELNPLRRIAVGAAATFPTRSRFAVQLGAGYSRKGSAVRTAFSDGVPVETTREADYLDMTMLGRAEYNPAGSRFNLHLLAGPFLAFPVSSCTRYSSPRYVSETCEAADSLSPIDLGLAVGGGMDLRVTGRFAGTVDVLYGHRLLYSDGLDIRHAGDGGFLRTLALRGGLAYNFH